MVIRHGEKPGAPISDPGIDSDGNTDSKSLTATGWRRARALVRVFHPKEGDPAAGLSVPEHLIAASDQGGDGSKRPIETLTPLSHSFDPSLTIDSSIDAKDVAGLTHTAVSLHGTVLVAWKHEHILEIASRLSPQARLPANWPVDRFDIVWVFNRSETGTYDFSQVPERALPGDSEALL